MSSLLFNELFFSFYELSISKSTFSRYFVSFPWALLCQQFSTIHSSNCLPFNGLSFPSSPLLWASYSSSMSSLLFNELFFSFYELSISKSTFSRYFISFPWALLCQPFSIQSLHLIVFLSMSSPSLLILFYELPIPLLRALFYTTNSSFPFLWALQSSCLLFGFHELSFSPTLLSLWAPLCQSVSMSPPSPR